MQRNKTRAGEREWEQFKSSPQTCDNESRENIVILHAAANDVIGKADG